MLAMRLGSGRTGLGRLGQGGLLGVAHLLKCLIDRAARDARTDLFLDLRNKCVGSNVACRGDGVDDRIHGLYFG